jgi:aspartate aminotransferase
MSLFDQVPTVPLDGTFALMEACRADGHELKVNLTPGIYRDENANTWVLPSVKQASYILINNDTAFHPYPTNNYPPSGESSPPGGRVPQP